MRRGSTAVPVQCPPTEAPGVVDGPPSPAADVDVAPAPEQAGIASSSSSAWNRMIDV